MRSCSGSKHLIHLGFKPNDPQPKSFQKKCRKMQNLLTEEEGFKAEASFSCQEDMVKIPSSGFPLGFVSPLFFSPVGMGPGALSLGSWGLQGQVTKHKELSTVIVFSC